MTQKTIKKTNKYDDYYVNGQEGIAIHKHTREVISIEKWKRIVSLNLLPFINWG